VLTHTSKLTIYLANIVVNSIILVTTPNLLLVQFITFMGRAERLHCGTLLCSITSTCVFLFLFHAHKDAAFIRVDAHFTQQHLIIKALYITSRLASINIKQRCQSPKFIQLFHTPRVHMYTTTPV